MAKPPKDQPIVIRRSKRSAKTFHGGMWKIAYADFVTAMMAFFLLMWLMGSTTQSDLNGIAEYFSTPLEVALTGGPRNSQSSGVMHGGGTDFRRVQGQVRHGTLPPKIKVARIRPQPVAAVQTPAPAPKPAPAQPQTQARPQTVDLDAARTRVEQEDHKRLNALKQRLEQAISANPMLLSFRSQLRLDLTREGLRIQIVDDQNRPMFDSGSAMLKNYAKSILHELVALLNGVPNRISVAGHTDAAQYMRGTHGYSNWELSTDRANAARRELVADGLDDDKIIRVVGLGTAVMLDQADPLDPVNRRISITVLNRKTEHEIMSDGVRLSGAALRTVPTATAAASPDGAQQPVARSTVKADAAPAGASM
jgi:chemotaxis protein MotB